MLLLLSGLLGSALLAWSLGWARTWLLALVSERMAADLRTAAFEHLLRLSLDYFGAKRTGDLMARVGSETDRISVFLSLHALDFATDVLMIGMTSVILFSIDPGLALVTLLPLPFIAWMIHRVRDRLRTGFEKIDRVWSDVTSVLADTIPGIRVVKAFAQEEREAHRFREANRLNLAVNDKLNKTWSLFSPTVSLLTDIGLLVVWAFGIWQVSRGRITVGVLTAFIAYIGRFYTRLDSMSRIVSVTQKAAAGAKRIFDILDHVSNVPEPLLPQKIERLEGRIELRGVGFRYGSRSVIRGLDLEIRPGEMIGLVGHSGSGKSTLVNLICRFYDVTDGAILVDGCDLRRFGVADYRRHIGLVLQEPFLFFGTVAENIAYGKPEATRAEIVAAARAAHAHEFILRLPQGYDSLVGERGQGLSGGERQRISIARALLIDPKDPDPGRGHVGGGHRDREGNPEGAGQPGEGPHDHRHRAPAVDVAQGRPAGGDGPRPGGGGGAARRPDRAARRLLAAVRGAGAARRRQRPGQRRRRRRRAADRRAGGGGRQHPCRRARRGAAMSAPGRSQALIPEHAVRRAAQ